jgi:hypothetical protein
MQTAKEISPVLIDHFIQTIKHLKGAPATDDNKAEGRAIIEHYTGRLQLLDLELSQRDARMILATAYRMI